MSNMRGAFNFKNQTCAGKQAFLPPKSPFPTVPPSYGDYGSIGLNGIAKPREGHRHHQRTSSESFLIEEQPSWLDELLNEPETPVKRGAHRRSSSDSFAYFDAASMYSNVDSSGQEEFRLRNAGTVPQWGAQEFDQIRDVQRTNYYSEAKPFARPQIRGWESGLNVANYPSSLPPLKDKVVHPGSSCVSREPDALASSSVADKHEKDESTQDSRVATEKKEGSHAKHSQSETDTKRVKQQFAQRSRVRKLQYIAELERNVQALQAEGMEVSAELKFMDQQNIILDLENKALKQRLDSLAQEQLVKRLQQEMLEKEIARLRLLFQQHQQLSPSPSPAPTHSRSNSRDLESQFTNLSLKPKEANAGRDPVTWPLRN
ncbi:Uncharacterized protein M6B38_242065 [Iris pallida]|uniref:BZIP domain-containing protein n=1 Tax=Iris pallida TaxID=29817 RepID=A0AAX6DK19_IRIPA|nr:Uncharacterized protein M6B38_242060 [Iris pallida]KAJ6792094.1 Uncharacterized protein M6B38_242065 [Iris pallida]